MVEVSMMERVARAIFRTGFAKGEDDAIVELKWLEWPDDRDRSTRRACAAIMALRDATLVYRDNGMVVHEMRGAPDDIWKTLLDAALSDTLKDHDV